MLSLLLTHTLCLAHFFSLSVSFPLYDYIFLHNLWYFYFDVVEHRNTISKYGKSKARAGRKNSADSIFSLDCFVVHSLIGIFYISFYCVVVVDGYHSEIETEQSGGKKLYGG